MYLVNIRVYYVFNVFKVLSLESSTGRIKSIFVMFLSGVELIKNSLLETSVSFHFASYTFQFIKLTRFPTSIHQKLTFKTP